MKAGTRVLYVLPALLLVVLVILALRLGWLDRETVPVRLPETAALLPEGEEVLNAGTLITASVTPETVQSVLATLSRPDSYSRRLRVESFWEGGSRAWLVDVWQKGSACRIRLLPEDGSGPEKNYLVRDGALSVWYEDPAQSFRRTSEEAADALEMIPTYEDVLALPPERITAAGYVLRGDAWRIMAACREEITGYETVYYVSIETGLLDSAERWDGETLIYRMSSGRADLAAPEDAVFYPEGTPAPEESGPAATD